MSCRIMITRSDYNMAVNQSDYQSTANIRRKANVYAKRILLCMSCTTLNYVLA